jgi:hypothetical protein
VSGDKIALAEAWQLFIETRFPGVIDPELHKPQAPHRGGVDQIVSARGFHSAFALGPEADSNNNIQWPHAFRAECAFRDLFALTQQAYASKAGQWLPVSFEDWFPLCFPRERRDAWREVEVYGPARCDGGARSWRSLLPTEAFPIEVAFDRADFEEAIALLTKSSRTPDEQLHPETANGENQHTRVRQLGEGSTADAIGKDERPRKVGRKSTVDPNLIRAEVFRLMDHHGDFTPEDTEWNCQARLEEAIADFITDRLSFPLSETRIRTMVRDGLASWKGKRGRKVTNN